MKINPLKYVKSLYYANKPVNLKPIKSNVKVVGELGEYARVRLEEVYPDIEHYAAQHGLKIRLAQKGNSLFMNSGGRTTLLNLKEMDSAREFQQAIYDNIKQNYNLSHIKK